MKSIPILIMVTSVGIISYLLITSTAPFSKGIFNNLNPKPASHAAVGNPYSGTPAAIPGTIQAELFDLGGEGVAYHDTDTANVGGALRPSEGVDIIPTTDSADSAGYVVQNYFDGEWMNYTVNVQTAGAYLLEARIASHVNEDAMHFEFNGVDKTGTLAVPHTGCWECWDIISKTVVLSAGQQTMRVVNDTVNTQGANMNWFRLTPTAMPTPSPTALPTPAPGTNSFTGEYWNYGTGNVPEMPVWINPNLIRNDPTINFTWADSPAPGINADHFVVRWNGKFSFNAGTYTFTTTDDDGVRVYVDNQKIIDHWVDEGPTTYTASVPLSAGTHTIRMEYYDDSQGAQATLAWSQTGTATPSPTPVGSPTPSPSSAPINIAGMVFYDSDNSGTHNGTEGVVPGIPVNVSVMGAQIASATTDANGSFSVSIPSSNQQATVGISPPSQYINTTNSFVAFTANQAVFNMFGVKIGGDIDGNRKVDIFDYNTLVGNFGKSGIGPTGGDIDNNGTVNIFDYNTIVGNFGKTG
jgi:hypothetical protein